MASWCEHQDGEERRRVLKFTQNNNMIMVSKTVFTSNKAPQKCVFPTLKVQMSLIECFHYMKYY